MPHQCTQCGHTFPDGSKEMLSGCPECGGNKFQFEPAADARTDHTDTAPDPAPVEFGPNAADTTADPAADSPDEDRAQADARREVAAHDEAAEESSPSESAVEPEFGPESEPDSGAETGDASEPDGSMAEDDSTMAALRRELDDQFESIKILEPGQYELNLMELYNREEYIVALQEDGQYVIEVPETWLGGDNE